MFFDYQSGLSNYSGPRLINFLYICGLELSQLQIGNKIFKTLISDDYRRLHSISTNYQCLIDIFESYIILNTSYSFLVIFLECENYTYGAHCSQTCGSCLYLAGEQCDHVTGECPRDCAAGYQGELCMEGNNTVRYVYRNCFKTFNTINVYTLTSS